MAERTADSFSTDIGQILSILPPSRKRALVLLGILMLAGALAEVLTIGAVVPFLAILAGFAGGEHAWPVTDFFETVGASSAGSQLVCATIFLCAAATAAGAFRLLLLRKTQTFVFSFGHALLVEIQRRALFQPYSWQLEHGSSEHLAVVAKVELVTYSILLQAMQAVTAAVFVVFVTGLLLQIAPLAVAVAALALGAAYLAAVGYARARLHGLSQDIDLALEERIRSLKESFGGIRDIILDGTQQSAVDKLAAIDRRLALARTDTVFLAALPRTLIEPIGIVSIALLALVVSRGEGGLLEAIPMLGALALAAQRLLPLTQQLYVAWSNIAANKSLLRDISRRLQLPIAAPIVSAPALRFVRSIEFRDVSYTYSARSRAAVCGLNFSIPHGSRVAVLGRTGSGKSTTADLLMGLIAPSSGTILIDRVPLTDENRHRWRANIAHVPQRLFLAEGTIAQNIALTGDVDPVRLRQAAAYAQLEEFIGTLPAGYETRIGESGARLSGGQRQRLAIARAIYKQAPVLVLDEATSALDEETERAVLHALDRLQDQGRTIIVIAHRGAVRDNCDLLIRLEHGQMNEQRSASLEVRD